MRWFSGQLRLAVLLACGLHAQAVPYELGVVAIFRNEARNLREWIEYHRLAGVEHFWLYNHGSTDNWEKVLSPYIEEGLVEITCYSSEEIYPPIQMVAFKDGIARAQGKARWVALIDVDEFIVPMENKTIPECLKEHFPHADAVYVNWRNFGTSHVTLAQNESTIFTLTECSLVRHPANWNGKSIVRPDRICIKDVWNPHHFPLIPGSIYVDGSNEPMVHSRENDPIPDGRHHDAFIRINHYALRDEAYFTNVRMANPTASQRNLYKEHYSSFSLDKDTKIIWFLSRHSEECKRIWGVDPKRYETGTRGVVCSPKERLHQ